MLNYLIPEIDRARIYENWNYNEYLQLGHEGKPPIIYLQIRGVFWLSTDVRANAAESRAGSC